MTNCKSNIRQYIKVVFKNMFKRQKINKRVKKYHQWLLLYSGIMYDMKLNMWEASLYVYNINVTLK